MSGKSAWDAVKGGGSVSAVRLDDIPYCKRPPAETIFRPI